MKIASVDVTRCLSCIVGNEGTQLKRDTHYYYQTDNKVVYSQQSSLLAASLNCNLKAPSLFYYLETLD